MAAKQLHINGSISAIIDFPQENINNNRSIPIRGMQVCFHACMQHANICRKWSQKRLHITKKCFNCINWHKSRYQISLASSQLDKWKFNLVILIGSHCLQTKTNTYFSSFIHTLAAAWYRSNAICSFPSSSRITQASAYSWTAASGKASSRFLWYGKKQRRAYISIKFSKTIWSNK